MASHQSNTDTNGSPLKSLISAVQDGQFLLVQTLIMEGFDVTQRDNHGWTALTHAVAVRQWNIFQLLSKAYCFSDLKTRKNLGHLIAAMEERRFKKLIKLAKGDNSFKELTKQEKTALLFLAINHSCPSNVLAIMINDRSDVTMRYHCGMTPLLLATVIGDHETLKAILSYKPDLYTTDDLGKSMMSYIIEKGCSKCLQMLLDADFENRCALDKTMNPAFVRGQGECMLALMNRSRTHDLQHDGTDSLLCEAASEGNLQCLDIMLHYGVDASLANPLGETALMHAVIKHRIHFLDCLLQHGVKIDAVDYEGNTALMHAVQRMHPECVTRLLEFGADVNVVNASSMTAISMACIQNYTDILQLILTTASSNLRIGPHSLALKLAVKFCNINALVLLMDNGIFLWPWMDDLNLKQVSPELIAKAALESGTRPGHFCWQNQRMTLLKFAFHYNNPETVRFLLANHYLTDYDVRVLPRDKDFISCIRKDSLPQTVALLNQLTSQPWSLQTLSFLAISSAIIAPTNDTHAPWQRNAMIERLPLPQKLITKLTFRSTLSRLCVDQWKKIGVQTPEDGASKEVNLLSNASPMWKDCKLPEKCEKGQCNNNDEGFKLRLKYLHYRKYIRC